MKFDTLYFMGDSWTFAAGQADDVRGEVTHENRFSGIISKKLNLPCINNALPGCGNQHIFRTVYEDINTLVKKNKKPLACIFYTDSARNELYSIRNKYPINISEEFSIDFFKFYMTECYDIEYLKQQTMYYIMAVRTLLEKYQIPYVDGWAMAGYRVKVPYTDDSHELEKGFEEITGVNRFDYIGPNGHTGNLGHANVKGNSLIADAVLEKMSQLGYI